MSLYAKFTRKGPSGFGYGSTAQDVTEGLDLSGKTYLLTGCNSGIGLESLRVLGLRGAHVLAAARTEQKATGALLTAGTAGTPIVCDLAQPDTVRAAVQAVKDSGRTLDGILCNAGIMALPKLHQRCGYELQFFTNHIGHFLLVTGLMDQLTDDARVTVTASDAHKQAPRVGIEFDNLSGERRYRSWRAYAHSKFANILFAKELAQRFKGTGRTANSVHPGVIKTNLARHMNPLAGLGMAIAGPVALKSIAEGAATQIYAATHPDAANHRGEYLKDCNVGSPRRPAEDPALAAQLWETSERIAAEI
jgi:WW domain-containing oxidoreductase